MRLIILSDTHQQHRKVKLPDGDVLIHCGDFTNIGSIPAVADFANWIQEQPHKHKICINGNHGFFGENANRGVGLGILRNAGLIYLEDSGIEIDGINFYGSPWTPVFNNWAFNLPRNGPEIVAKWDLIPDNTNVLITHGAPAMILDEVYNDFGLIEHAGCEKLLQRLDTLPNLKIACWGHLHREAGWPKTLIKNGITFINASICNNGYKPINPPIVIDI